MSREFIKDKVSTVKVSIYFDENGYILAEGDQAFGQKNITFHGFASSMTAAEAVNSADSPALHNGVSGLMWLFCGFDKGNFNENFVRTISEEMSDE